MFGVDPLSITSMIILAGYQPECPAHDPTKINVTPVSEKVKYDFSQSLKQLQTYRTDTIDPYSFHGRSITQAFMKGGVSIAANVSFKAVQSKFEGYVCVWYDEINVEIKVDPTIVMAKEIYHDPCMRKAVIEHELKHVKVDRLVLNKYSKSIGNRLMNDIKSRGFTAGPLAIDRIEEVKEKMSHVVRQIIDLEDQKMDIERRERQLQVDTRDEYDRVDDQCPHFEKKKSIIYADLLD